MSLSKAIDVSSYQGNINFKKVKASGINNVILRCGGRGYGKTHSLYADNKFEENYKKAKEAGMDVGAYFYSGATNTTEALEEANYVLKLIKGKRFELPIYWDTEDNHDTKKYYPKSQLSIGKAALTEIGKKFLSTIEAQHYYVGIYASKSWLISQLDMSKLSDYAVWVAQYNTKCTYEGTYGMWQYSSTGKVDGISGSVDMNYLYVDYATAVKNLGLNGYPVPGDITGDRKVTAEDARLALRASVGLENLSEQQRTAADIDRDGKVEADDAREILRKSVD